MSNIKEVSNMNGMSELDPMLGYVPAIPLPYYCWQFWKWQKVRCQCGREFISRNLGLLPPEYKAHFVLSHINPLEEECLKQS